MAAERKLLQFVHYETKEIRTVPEPLKLQQYSREFITAFMTSEENAHDLSWYRGMVHTCLEEVKAKEGDLSLANLQIKAFPAVRIEFVKKYFPQHAPKEKVKKPAKPKKLDMWDL